MPDGTSRLRCKGQQLFHFMGTSTFAEYCVVAEISVAKVNPAASTDAVCLLGCGISTGYGAAINTAKVQSGQYFCLDITIIYYYNMITDHIIGSSNYKVLQVLRLVTSV